MTTDILEPISGFNKGDAVRMKDGSDKAVAHIETIFDQKRTPGGVGLDRELGGFKSWNVSELELAPVEHYRAFQISILSTAISAVANNAMPSSSSQIAALSRAAQGAARLALSNMGSTGVRRAETVGYVTGVLDTLSMLRPCLPGTDQSSAQYIEHDLITALGMICTALVTDSAVMLAASRAEVDTVGKKLTNVASALKSAR